LKKTLRVLSSVKPVRAKLPVSEDVNPKYQERLVNGLVTSCHVLNDWRCCTDAFCFSCKKKKVLIKNVTRGGDLKMTSPGNMIDRASERVKRTMNGYTNADEDRHAKGYTHNGQTGFPSFEVEMAKRKETDQMDQWPLSPS
jgi:hypothetical protein